MTYKEALKVKEDIGLNITFNKVTMKIYVVPSKESDFIKFLEYFYLNKITDSTAIKFSTNGDFTVNGLYRLGTWTLYLTLDEI